MRRVRATPTMLPVPTREAVDTISAWKDDTFCSPEGFSMISLQAVPNRRICTKRVRKVKSSPAAASTMMRIG